MPTYALTFNPDAGKSTDMIAACDSMVVREEHETDLAFLQRIARLHFLDILAQYRAKNALSGVAAVTTADWPD